MWLLLTSVILSIFLCRCSGFLYWYNKNSTWILFNMYMFTHKPNKNIIGIKLFHMIRYYIIYKFVIGISKWHSKPCSQIYVFNQLFQHVLESLLRYCVCIRKLLSNTKVWVFFFFFLCARCWQFSWIILFFLQPLRYSLTFIRQHSITWFWKRIISCIESLL